MINSPELYTLSPDATNGQKAKFLVMKYVKEDKRFWPREIKIANSRLKKHSDSQFWNELELGFQLNSLAWFKSVDGLKKLNSHNNRKIDIFAEKPAEQNKEVDKIQETDKIRYVGIGRPKTLLDFLK